MRLLTAIAAGLSTLAGVSAQAHPGPAILSAGGAETRSTATEGVSVTETNGVHLIMGSPTKHAAKTPPQAREKIIMLTLEVAPFRSVRRLRSQGFYSGVSYRSRRYSQGFYSGR